MKLSHSGRKTGSYKHRSTVHGQHFCFLAIVQAIFELCDSLVQGEDASLINACFGKAATEGVRHLDQAQCLSEARQVTTPSSSTNTQSVNIHSGVGISRPSFVNQGRASSHAQEESVSMLEQHPAMQASSYPPFFGRVEDVLVAPVGLSFAGGLR